jgi:hypothetical protein
LARYDTTCDVIEKCQSVDEAENAPGGKAICGIYDIGEEPLFAIEYLDGETLKRLSSAELGICINPLAHS